MIAVDFPDRPKIYDSIIGEHIECVLRLCSRWYSSCWRNNRSRQGLRIGSSSMTKRIPSTKTCSPYLQSGTSPAIKFCPTTMTPNGGPTPNFSSTSLGNNNQTETRRESKKNSWLAPWRTAPTTKRILPKPPPFCWWKSSFSQVVNTKAAKTNQQQRYFHSWRHESIACCVWTIPLQH